ncbi:MAG: maleylpyruvate isomerase family mycothiol-dependent enzyme [Acidimicrobiia bacterium]|nr:maleylpyruvate isomerase family mycothiol-dependent enzyme [Acidimicrobiia bacterium]
MSKSDVYQGCRERLITLAGRLSAPQLRAPVPACPGWSVKDTFAHLVGGSTDYVRDHMEGAGSEAWTARQVEDRRNMQIGDLVEEWQVHESLFDKKFERAGNDVSAIASDIWCHEYDISGALGWRGSREPERVEWGARAVRAIPRLLNGTGLDVPQIIADGEVVVEGDGPILRSSPYELARMVYGRRSWDQIRAMDWDRDPEPYLEHLSFFPAPADDLID